MTDKRLTGIAVPLAALRTARSCGCGEFRDLIELAAALAPTGIGLIQTLPLNDSGWQSSPYSALTAFGLHPLYASIDAFPEAKGMSSALDALKARLDVPGRFDYGAVLDAKQAALASLWETCRAKASGSSELESWIGANAWVKPYAAFLALKEGNAGASWVKWAAHRDPEDIEGLWRDDRLFDRTRHVAWVQMRLDAQLAEAAAGVRERKIALEGDLPILINEDSAEVWASRRYFKTGVAAGAPPDMYSEEGQNWGFPTYDWDELERDGHAFWKARLAQAERYFDAYRIDHVLGFFRIWTLPEGSVSGALGWFDPCRDASLDDLASIGVRGDRLAWLSRPHVPGRELRDSCAPAGDDAFARAVDAALSRIGDEDLYRFKPTIRGERDLESLPLPAEIRDHLAREWRNRALFERSPGRFVRSWKHASSRAWRSLDDAERKSLDGYFSSLERASEDDWERRGEALLSMLRSSTAMLPCAEDLGAVPSCVPRVLERLGILGLRLPRWTRDWSAPGQPWIALEGYPELSACAVSVHDTSTFRGWWKEEADRESFARFLAIEAGRDVVDPAAHDLTPESQIAALATLARCRSRFFVMQLQDALDASPALRSPDPEADRINVPGTTSSFNWTWRMPRPVAALRDDGTFIEAMRKVVAAHGEAPAHRAEARGRRA